MKDTRQKAKGFTGLVLSTIRLYQRVLSPLKSPCCRFYPSCSSYAHQAITQHGLWVGGWLTVRRIGRCHPFHPGGVDLPPKS
ncbi:MAG: membrane protein insertion efficiency factor YidD [Myxococcota bacterium]